MSLSDLVQQAINSRKVISFNYTKAGKIQGVRIGNPHALYVFTTKAGERSTKLDIVQTGGVSDSQNEKPLPSWRMFDMSDIDNVTLLNENFSVNADYNSNSDRYQSVIAKI